VTYFRVLAEDCARHRRVQGDKGLGTFNDEFWGRQRSAIYPSCHENAQHRPFESLGNL
jgi:hypothetical protein